MDTPNHSELQLTPNESFTDARYVQPTQESPLGSLSDSQHFAIQIHESYDIRNDDENEDVFVSYDIYDDKKDTTNAIPIAPDSNRNHQRQRQQSFVSNINHKLQNEYSGESFRNTFVKTDSLLFHPITYEDTSSLIATRPVSFTDNKTPDHLPGLNSTANDDDYMSAQNSSPNPRAGVIVSMDSQIRSTLENAFIKSNSPISSQSNSDSETDPDQEEPDTGYMINEHVENAFANRRMRFKKISYDEIERSLSKYYDKNNKYSNEVDILITFIRGQKHLYNQSNLLTQTKLYAITITALTISSLIIVITPFIQKYWWKIIFVMSGNAITTVLITVLKYMRFETASNTFTLLANHYEHYEKSLQLTTNKLVFVTDETEQNKIVLDKMREIEFKMSETHELCPVIIPSEVQTTFPVIYQTNIFTLIKKMDVHRKTLILQLKNIKNEIRYILFKWNSTRPAHDFDLYNIREHTVDPHEGMSPQMRREKIRVLFLMEQKERIKKELIEYRDNYSQIDELFMKEIKYAELNKKCWRWFWCNPKKIQYDTFTNPVIKEHLELILGN